MSNPLQNFATLAPGDSITITNPKEGRTVLVTWDASASASGQVKGTGSIAAESACSHAYPTTHEGRRICAVCSDLLPETP